MKYPARLLCTLLMTLTCYAHSDSENSFDQVVKEDCMSLDDTWYGYLSSFGQSLGSPAAAFWNELYWRMPELAGFGAIVLVNTLFQGNDPKRSASMIGKVVLVTGAIQLTHSGLAAYFIPEDSTGVNAVSASLSALTYATPSLVMAFEPLINAARHPGCVNCAAMPFSIVLGAASLVPHAIPLLHNPAVTNLISQKSPDLNLIGQIYHQGGKLNLCSPEDSTEPHIYMAAHHKRTETALFKHVDPASNPCKDTTNFTAKDLKNCKHAMLVNQLYTVKQEQLHETGVTSTVLHHNDLDLDLRLIGELDQLTIDKIQQALLLESDSLLEASKPVDDYSETNSVRDDWFQYFLSAQDEQGRYLLFGVQMNTESDEFTDWGVTQFNYLAQEHISYFPHIAIVAEFPSDQDLTGLSDALFRFFKRAKTHAALFQISEPTNSDQNYLDEISGGAGNDIVFDEPSEHGRMGFITSENNLRTDESFRDDQNIASENEVYNRLATDSTSKEGIEAEENDLPTGEISADPYRQDEL